jgi:hypothetical protein
MEPKRDSDGTLAFNLPMADKKLPGIVAEDIGRCSYGILKRPDLIGKRVGIAGEHLTGAQMAAELSQALGETVRYNYVPPEIFRGLGFPGAEDIGNMFQYFRDFEAEFAGARSIEFSRSLNPALQTFKAWLKDNASRIPVEGKKVSA